MSNAILSALRARGIKQGTLAQACGVDKSAVSRWVRWGAPIPEKHLSVVSQLTGIQPPELRPDIFTPERVS